MSWQTVVILFAALIAVRIALNFYAKLYPPENLVIEDLSGKKLASASEYYVVDIRTPNEWKETGVIKGAHLLTFGSPESFLNEIRPKLASYQKLALICRSGNRSSRAARKVTKRVNWSVVDVQGGMTRVLGNGYKTVQPTRAMGCETC